MLGGHNESLHDLHSIHFPILMVMFDSHKTLYDVECIVLTKVTSWKGESGR